MAGQQSRTSGSQSRSTFTAIGLVGAASSDTGTGDEYRPHVMRRRGIAPIIRERPGPMDGSAPEVDMSFRNRSQAGRRLSEALREFDSPDLVVIGLARGGVAVAAEVARGLGRPLDAAIVRKVRVPFATEVAMGAVGEDGSEFIEREFLESAAITPAELARSTARARTEATSAVAAIRAGEPPLDVSGHTIILVDDGIATGSTAKVACLMMRRRGASRIVLAAPVGPRDIAREFGGLADDVVILESPEPFFAVGAHYEWFPQLTDRDVIDLLERSGHTPRAADPSAGESDGDRLDEHVTIPTGPADESDGLIAELHSPPQPTAAVVFVHGRGSDRHSTRNIFIASALNDAGYATLLFDLATRAESADGSPDLDLTVAAERTRAAVRWLRQRMGDELPIALVGSSTGAAVALATACGHDSGVATVICRGGRVDLASGTAPVLQVPVLLIVGGDDDLVLTWNRRFATALESAHELVVIEGATHLFAEPGALDRCTEVMTEWLDRQFASTRRTPTAAG